MDTVMVEEERKTEQENVQGEQTKLEFLKETRKRYYDNDWFKMLRDYKIRASNGPKQLKEELLEDVAVIEQALLLKPKDGFYYKKNVSCRIPVGMGLDDFKKALHEHVDNLPPEAVHALNEMIHILSNKDDYKKPVRYYN